MKPALNAAALTALAALAVAACSSGTTGGTDPDAGTPDETTPAYWGLVDDTCFHYVDAEGRERYTVGIEQDDRSVPGTTTYHLEHRFQGLEVESDWVAPKDGQLLLYRRSLTPIGEASVLWRFETPVVMLEKGLETGDSRTTKGKVTRSGGGATTTEDVTVDMNVFANESVAALDATLDAQKFNVTTNYADSTQRTDRLWFVPEKGLVKYDPAGEYDPTPNSTSEEVFILKSVETLPAGDPCVTK